MLSNFTSSYSVRQLRAVIYVSEIVNIATCYHRIYYEIHYSLLYNDVPFKNCLISLV